MNGGSTDDPEPGDDRPVVDFWFDFASPYSYLAAMVIEDRAGQTGRRVAWQPVTMGPIFADLGWHDSPFNRQPAKRAYMWRDVERLAATEGLTCRPTDPFPLNSVAAARLALVALDESWGPAFCRAVFHAAFAAGADISDADILSRLALEAGGDARAMTRALSPEHRPRLRSQVERARKLDLFGAPVFLVNGEMFWGFDRLDAALSWPA